MQNAAGRAGIKGVSLRGSGSSGWTELSNDWGARWETGQQPGSSPFDMQITQDDGQVVSHDRSFKTCRYSSLHFAKGQRA